MDRIGTLDVGLQVAHTILHESEIEPGYARDVGSALRMMDRLKGWMQSGAWSLLLELALFIALGASLAHWTWVAMAPRTLAASALGDQGAAPAVPVIRRNLFGAAQAGTGAPVAEAAPSSKIRLLGVLSRGPAGKGRAIFVLETGKPKTVEAGTQIVPGYVLKEVQPDHVLIARDGVVERLTLDRRIAAKK